MRERVAGRRRGDAERERERVGMKRKGEAGIKSKRDIAFVCAQTRLCYDAKNGRIFFQI